MMNASRNFCRRLCLGALLVPSSFASVGPVPLPLDSSIGLVAQPGVHVRVEGQLIQLLDVLERVEGQILLVDPRVSEGFELGRGVGEG